MIRKLTGTIAEVTDSAAVVEVNQIGYLVYTNQTANLGEITTFFTHLAVRENALDLYGFFTQEELIVFELLLTLPKIGPKSALQIMSKASLDLIKEAVTNNDPSYLSKISGIGKKSAEKIVAGLKDKLEGIAPGLAGQSPASPGAPESDTIDALITLGYSPNEARTVVITINKEQPDLIASNDILKAALRQLSN